MQPPFQTGDPLQMNREGKELEATVIKRKEEVARKKYEKHFQAQLKSKKKKVEI